MDVQNWIDKGYDLLVEYTPKVIAAILIWIIGSWLIGVLLRLVKKTMNKSDYDESLKNFLLNLIKWSLKIVLFIVVLGTVGIETTTFAAVIAAAGLAIGLALQGSLANFAGGVLILLLKPFKVGDWISAQGVDGSVKEISIFNTKIITFGNQEAVIPNGKLSNDNIINYSSLGIRRESLTFGIGYDDNIKEAKDILLNLVNEQKTVLKEDEDKTPMVAVGELGDSSVNLILRYWSKNEDFWDLRWCILEEGKSRLEAAGITIPYPQRDVHNYNVEK